MYLWAPYANGVLSTSISSGSSVTSLSLYASGHGPAGLEGTVNERRPHPRHLRRQLADVRRERRGLSGGDDDQRQRAHRDRDLLGRRDRRRPRQQHLGGEHGLLRHAARQPRLQLDDEQPALLRNRALRPGDNRRLQLLLVGQRRRRGERPVRRSHLHEPLQRVGRRRRGRLVHRRGADGATSRAATRSSSPRARTRSPARRRATTTTARRASPSAPARS